MKKYSVQTIGGYEYTRKSERREAAREAGRIAKVAQRALMVIDTETGERVAVADADGKWRDLKRRANAKEIRSFRETFMIRVKSGDAFGL